MQSVQGGLLSYAPGQGLDQYGFPRFPVYGFPHG